MNRQPAPGDPRAPAEELREQLAEHLERLRQEGVWGLKVEDVGTGDSPVDGSQTAVSKEIAPAPADESPAQRSEVAISAESPARVSAAPRREAPAMPAQPRAPEPAAQRPVTARVDTSHQVDLFGGGQPGLLRADADETLRDVEAEALACVACALHRGRTNVVFGVGDPHARLMFIGEGPGRDEDLQGEPFVGRAGQLLTRIIEAMDLRREDVYIANAVKCRPPQNRNPQADELDACNHFLMRQIALIRPQVIVLLGRIAVQTVLGSTAPLSRLRGNFQEWRGIRVMCTYHPAYLLRNPNAKKDVWEDMQLVRDVLAADSSS